MRRSLTIFLFAAMLGATFALPVAAGEGSNTPDPAAEQDFLGRINAERNSRGLRALSWHAAAASVARNHSEDMARDGRIYHNDRLGSQMSGWASLGENVGVGPSTSALHGAFMGSETHRNNILGDFTHLGVGVIERDGSLWVTQVFVTPQSSGGSNSSGDDEPRRRKARRSSRSAQVEPVPAPAVKRRAVAPRSVRRVEAASAAPVHGIAPPPGPVVGLGTVAALERFAQDDDGARLMGCLPREAC